MRAPLRRGIGPPRRSGRKRAGRTRRAVSLRAAAPGVAAGGALAFAATRFITETLFGVEPRDPATFALAVAVLLDATVVRAILLPATMRLLGERNWYLPRVVRGARSGSTEAPHPGPASAANAESSIA